ncbi:inositol monophosphatase family protein [Anaerocolumna xylanovorans]|uniref:Inositol-1-monophosphatase n=1 Tax=Anaerocolumna xylanovorans DSM 12503 TaxID=1121345 RepID=A0A1M7XYK1_9FIRM|nr:inositol monophosphatase family protein [Anaerocolumna xylanovorans]SHO44140.1 myo-inositol-1(or 4)-monophosphatase [Anaerocolumna xylanovorans DSM 12503]
MTDEVIKIVREAGKILQNRNFEVQSKGTVSNNVTTTDIAVQAYLKEQLSKLLDDSSFVGEEGEEMEYGKQFRYQWMVDPIDGTANFIRDMGLSAISVGLLDNGKPVLGVVYNPYRDEMFYAAEGKGSFLNGIPIKVSDRDFAHSAFCTAMSLYNKDYAKPCFNIIEKVYKECDDIRRLGSAALELVYLACGRVDIYFEIRVFPWDFAAAEIIIREAGGYVGTVGFENTVFDRPIPLICANTKENYERLKKIVKEEIPSVPYTR